MATRGTHQGLPNVLNLHVCIKTDTTPCDRKMRIILYILTVNQSCYTWKFHIYEVTNQTFHFDFKNLFYLKPASCDDEALDEEAVGNDEEDGVGEFVKSMTLLSSSCQRRVMSLFLKSH